MHQKARASETSVQDDEIGKWNLKRDAQLGREQLPMTHQDEDRLKAK
jgi:hypothetical protein